MNPLPTHKRLTSLLHYEPETGVFRWRQTRNWRCPVGAEAGTLRFEGYRAICVDGRLLTAHRLALFYATGRWPETDVDHINGCRADNRLVNLRELDRSSNCQNMHKSHRDSKVGLLGVLQYGERFTAQIRFQGRNRHLGCFDTAAEAHRAYLSAKAKHHAAWAANSTNEEQLLRHPPKRKA